MKPEQAEQSEREKSTQEGSCSPQLANIRDALQTIAAGSEADAQVLKNELAIIVKQLDDAMRALQQQQIAQKSINQAAVANQDLERELRRVAPLQPGTPDGPHRVDWKTDIGF